MGRDELRSLAAAGGIAARTGDRWLTVAQLRPALLEALAPKEQTQSLSFEYQQVCAPAVTCCMFL